MRWIKSNWNDITSIFRDWNDIPKTMTIRLYRENSAGCHIEYYPKTADAPFTFNDVVMLSTDGQLAKYTDTANLVPIGLIQKTIVSADSDYSSTTKTPVLVCGESAEFLCDVGNGVGAVGDVGEFIDMDGNGNPHQDIDVSASDFDIMEVTQFVSTTQMICKFNVKTGILATGPAS